MKGITLNQEDMWLTSVDAIIGNAGDALSDIGAALNIAQSLQARPNDFDGITLMRSFVCDLPIERLEIDAQKCQTYLSERKWGRRRPTIGDVSFDVLRWTRSRHDLPEFMVDDEMRYLSDRLASVGLLNAPKSKP